MTALATHHDGKRLNGPNDVVVHSDGTIWFTDPHYGINTDYEGGKQPPDLPPLVCRLDVSRGELTIVADDFAGPNGLCFSPDEQLLCIAESGTQFASDPVRHIRVFAVETGGWLTQGRVFHTVSPGYSDGLRCDQEGRIWTSAGDGVHCVGPDGALLGKILTGCAVSNLVFGGRNGSRLFLCAGDALKAIYANVRGAQWP